MEEVNTKHAMKQQEKFSKEDYLEFEATVKELVFEGFNAGDAVWKAYNRFQNHEHRFDIASKFFTHIDLVHNIINENRMMELRDKEMREEESATFIRMLMLKNMPDDFIMEVARITKEQLEEIKQNIQFQD